MKMLSVFIFAILLINLTPTRVVLQVHAQTDPSGFISIDCGTPNGSNYTDGTTGIYYTSDAGFIDSGIGIPRTIASSFVTDSFERQFVNLTSFPNGTRNCYTLSPSLGRGRKYLIRASFMYGNYDSRNQPPMFDLHLGVEKWETVTFRDASTELRLEMIHVPWSNYIPICLVRTGLGIPFISVLELRPLNATIDMYPTSYEASLKLFARVDVNPLSNQQQLLRYKNDPYDRLWWPFPIEQTTTLATNSTVQWRGYDQFQPPSAVMKTAAVAGNASDSLEFDWNTDNSSDKFYLCLYFAELQSLGPNQTRAFNIYMNGVLWLSDPLVPVFLLENTIYPKTFSTGFSKYSVSLNRTKNSTLPPLINAVEIYTLQAFPLNLTDKTDVEAIMDIKSKYGLTKNWQGDPCGPQYLVWDGIGCTYTDFQPPRIVSLNLSSSGLTGTIIPSISTLAMLRTLDLSNNSLSGQVPDSLAQMDSLKVLNLKGNKFTGISQQLQQKSISGSLLLSIDLPVGGGGGNTTDNCGGSGSCKTGKSNVVLPVVASVVGVSLVVVAALIIWWVLKRRNKQRATKKVDAELRRNDFSLSLEVKNQQFTYSEVLSITNNFQKVIGKGGFGTVYHGYVGDTQVAVKMLSPASTQGYKEFQAEAHVLMNVHHKNLTSLVGFCNEGTNMAIIYEYMANGNLGGNLSDRNRYVLTWEERLRITVDTAEGLEYLHHGCKPPIIHRDVKTTNILLNEKFQAKLADFGLSRAFPVEGDTHVSTVAAGTPGYLDPEYYVLNRMTEKSDVFSFGVVLLEIITGRPAIPRQPNGLHVIQWVSSTLERGNVKDVVDPRLFDEFDVNSAWKAVEVAMACVSRNSGKRPRMNLVVIELKECLGMEIARLDSDSKSSIGVIPFNLDSSGLGPLAR